jgi:hypothetical protein
LKGDPVQHTAQFTLHGYLTAFDANALPVQAAPCETQEANSQNQHFQRGKRQNQRRAQNPEEQANTQGNCDQGQVNNSDLGRAHCAVLPQQPFHPLALNRRKSIYTGIHAIYQ